GAPTALEHVGRAEHPRTVADRRHRDALGRGVADELHHPAVAPHVVRRRSAGNHDELVVARLAVAGGLLALLWVAVLADVGLAGLGADDFYGVACLLQAEARVLEFEVFV